MSSRVPPAPRSDGWCLDARVGVYHGVAKSEVLLWSFGKGRKQPTRVLLQPPLRAHVDTVEEALALLAAVVDAYCEMVGWTPPGR